MLAHGVRFVETPREEPYGTVAVFFDLYENKWDLLQLREGNFYKEPDNQLFVGVADRKSVV